MIPRKPHEAESLRVDRSETRAPAGLVHLLDQLLPGATLLEARPLAADAGKPDDATGKAAGYGKPLLLRLGAPDGTERFLVFRTAGSDDFGHDRRSDRAQGILLAHDTFPCVPRHVRSIDVGAIREDGRLLSLQSTGEFYLVTEYAPGTIYAEDLRRIARQGEAQPIDVDRARALATYLVELHRPIPAGEAAYRRSLRDLVGHGEGIFGIVDGYPADTPAAPPARLEAIEHRAIAWRWRLRERAARLCRIHGDFHPFNVLFEEGNRFTLLDTSRGSMGDPADDVSSMAINYVFFALDRPAAWAQGLALLWRGFWEVYLAHGHDAELLEVVAPFWAWRSLVLACPKFYPSLPETARDALLGLAERVLDAPRFDPRIVEDLFR